MTQQPFSRPGAIDLSALKRPAPAQPAPGGPGAPVPAAATGSSYAVGITEENFQATIEASMSAPVLLVFYSRTRMPESGNLADDLETLSGEFEGRFLVGLVDVDAAPAIAQALQIESIPFVYAVIDGRPAPLFQDVLPIAELRTALTQVMQQLTTQGVTGRHQPRAAGSASSEADANVVASDPGAEPDFDPRYAAAQDALGEGDIDRAVAEYEKLVSANPADAEAAAGLSMARVLKRTQGVDLQTARAAGAANPDDIDAQTLVADLDLLGGHVDDAFHRLIEFVRRSVGDDKNKAREHLLGLFAAVGNDDPRVLKGRQNLASALF